MPWLGDLCSQMLLSWPSVAKRDTNRNPLSDYCLNGKNRDSKCPPRKTHVYYNVGVRFLTTLLAIEASTSGETWYTQPDLVTNFRKPDYLRLQAASDTAESNHGTARLAFRVPPATSSTWRFEIAGRGSKVVKNHMQNGRLNIGNYFATRF